jgi:2,3-diaminopropionate biosynthesis protein SbnB
LAISPTSRSASPNSRSRDDAVAILSGSEVSALLAGRELELIQVVRTAYETHGAGDSSLPYSTFLRFPDQPQDRIIALPAYLGGESRIAGVKWVSSFPENLKIGLDRASAVLILNSPQTGRPEAVLEGSVISAKRTAASAALAAHCLLSGSKVGRVGMIGCGLINFEIARFLLAVFPKVEAFVLFDKDSARAKQFRNKLQRTFDRVGVEIAADVKGVLRSSPLIAIATTAATPHISDLGECARGSAILHISLRDLTPDVILSCDNVVDDIDHVCRAQTSVHLAEQLVGHRDFIRCTLADILTGRAPARNGSGTVSVFSPFGLGVLDIAVGKLARDLAAQRGVAKVIDSFFPSPWAEEAERSGR